MLSGFALCTDEDMLSVYAAGYSTAWLLCGAHDCGDEFRAWMSAGVLRLNTPTQHALWKQHF